jgi:uncharacterized protein (DUF1697 family)
VKPHRYAAFLRAVNVGGRTVKMDQLRAAFQSLGYTGVETFIASGNVVFESSVKKTADLERAIEAMLEQKFGFRVATIVRTMPELAEAARQEPFKGRGDVALHVMFLRDAPSKEAARAVEALSNDVDQLRVRGREIYWLARQGMGKTTLPGGRVEKAAATEATVRSVTTVRKMAAKYAADHARP